MSSSVIGATVAWLDRLNGEIWGKGETRTGQQPWLVMEAQRVNLEGVDRHVVAAKGGDRSKVLQFREARVGQNKSSFDVGSKFQARKAGLAECYASEERGGELGRQFEQAGERREPNELGQPGEQMNEPCVAPFGARDGGWPGLEGRRAGVSSTKVREHLRETTGEPRQAWLA